MKRIVLVLVTMLGLMLSAWAQGGSPAPSAPQASQSPAASPSQTDNKSTKDSRVATGHHHRRHHRHHRRKHHV